MLDDTNFGDVVHGLVSSEVELSEEEIRFYRAKKLLGSMKIEQVMKAEDNNDVEKGSLDFCLELAKVINGEVDGDITNIELKRLEDIYIWSMPNSKLSEEQKREVLVWCERDGHEELVDNIQQKMLKGNENG